MQITKTFHLKNPYRADQKIKQEVIISEDLIYDYSNSPWVAVDTEYLSFNPLQDKLCVIQVGSKENSDSESLRVELVWVFEKDVPVKLKSVLTNPNIEKLFHVFSSDVPRVEKFLSEKIQGSIFDTKLAAKIAWTNTQDHGMKSLIRMFVDPDFTQSDNEKGLNDWEVGPENWTDEQIFYMMQDVVYLDVLRLRILEMARRRGTEDLVLKAMEAIPVIAELYSRGYSESVFGY